MGWGKCKTYLDVIRMHGPRDEGDCCEFLFVSMPDVYVHCISRLAMYVCVFLEKREKKQ